MSQKSITPNKLSTAKFPKSASEKELEVLKSHKLAENEKHLYHIALLPQGGDFNTQTRIAPVRVQKYTQKAFKAISDPNKFQGFESVILHDPTVEEAAPSKSKK